MSYLQIIAIGLLGVLVPSWSAPLDTIPLERDGETFDQITIGGTKLAEVAQIDLSQIEISANYDLRRAKNLARQAAESANGGLQAYRAAAPMHGPVSELLPDTMRVNHATSVTFTFLGGQPGSDLTTIESEVQVDWNDKGWTTDVVYNGPPRTTATQVLTPDPLTVNPTPTATGSVTTTELGIYSQLSDTYDLNRAKNLARQAAENFNGGLSQYRAEASMHGPVTDLPDTVLQINSEASVTFVFKGGAPGTTLEAIESEIEVDYSEQAWAITVVYNGPPRLN